MDPNQALYDSSFRFAPPGYPPGNEIFFNQGTPTGSMPPARKPGSSLTRMPSLFLPATILCAFAWLLHSIATFIPYWSTYSGIDNSRAGLWSARNFTYQSIQNFYVPEPTDFPTYTDSIRFTSANTKGYLVTVQFLMTFNFVVMFIVLVLLIADYVFSQRSADGSGIFLIGNINSYDTGVRFGLLLYIIYVFGAFEFAAWITYVGSRHDNNWKMHVSFAFAVIVSVFLVGVFIMFSIEFIKRFEKSRSTWQHWYGPYMQWGFFVHLSALLLLLTALCCPEWAYGKYDPLSIFFEIGLFKQCYLSEIYKKSSSSTLCTLSKSSNNQAWVNASQAFILMAYIIGMIILILIVVFREEFRHDEQGYVQERVGQPMFTFIVAGLILFFCFIFSLIGVSVFGAKTIGNSLTGNWGYALAVIAMILFLIAGILFILDALHSERQTSTMDQSFAKHFIYPAPLNQRVMNMQSGSNQDFAGESGPPIIPWAPWHSMAPFDVPQGMDPNQHYFDPASFPAQSMMMMTPGSYGMDQFPLSPLTQAVRNNYVRQANRDAQWPSSTENRNDVLNESSMTDVLGQHIVRQQRLNYNHDRLLERYNLLDEPRVATFQTFGTSSLPGRDYDQYLYDIAGDYQFDNSVAAMSRSRVQSSKGDRGRSREKPNHSLPQTVSLLRRYTRDKPESSQVYRSSMIESTLDYIRSLLRDGSRRIGNRAGVTHARNGTPEEAEGNSHAASSPNQVADSCHGTLEAAEETSTRARHHRNHELKPSPARHQTDSSIDGCHA